MADIKKKKPLEPNAFVSSACNLACVFCSAIGQDRVMGEPELRGVLDAGFDTLAIEGGEPLLDKKLEARVARAAGSGTREIILFTNGLLLTPPRIKALLKSGVTRFNFNLPAHTGGLHDELTGSKGKLPGKLAAIREAIRLSPPKTVIVTFVVNSLNYKTLPAFAAFAAGELPGIFYVSLNMVKVKGRVKKNTALVPRFSEVEPYLLRSLAAAKASGLRVITDGFPLCFMKGFEELSVDPQKIIRRDALYMSEKARIAVCRNCSLAGICAGPRRDYLLLYGGEELKAAKSGARQVLAAVLKKA